MDQVLIKLVDSETQVRRFVLVCHSALTLHGFVLVCPTALTLRRFALVCPASSSVGGRTAGQTCSAGFNPRCLFSPQVHEQVPHLLLVAAAASARLGHFSC